MTEGSLCSQLTADSEADSARAATEELAVHSPGLTPPATAFSPIAYRKSYPARVDLEPGPTPRRTRAYLEANPGLPRGEPGAPSGQRTAGSLTLAMTETG